MTNADQHYENRFGSWEFKMAYVLWKYKFRFLAMQMWLQPIGWSSICRFLKFLPAFLWKAKILKKCRIDAGNWPARNSPIEPIQWIIQVIAFCFGWKRERERERWRSKKKHCIVTKFECVALFESSRANRGKNVWKTECKTYSFLLFNSIPSRVEVPSERAK